jgi:hypothetical protein
LLLRISGYKLCGLLREEAEDTANPERAQAMLWAADEIESLIKEIRNLTDIASARLIAAAPRMLEALRASLEVMGDTYDARDAAGTEGEQLRDQIAEAIAAATGEPADY